MQLACLERKCEEFTVFSSCVKGPLLGIFTPNSVFFFILILKDVRFVLFVKPSLCSSSSVTALLCRQRLVSPVVPPSLSRSGDCQAMTENSLWPTGLREDGGQMVENRWAVKRRENSGENWGLESVGTEDRHQELEKVDWGGRFYKIKIKKGERKRWIGEWAEEKERVLL